MIPKATEYNNDRLTAERMLRELEIRVEMKTLARLLRLLQRYGVKFEGESFDRLMDEMAKLRS